MAVAGINVKDDGVVTSNAFNLTRLTGLLAVIIGAATTLSGAAAGAGDGAAGAAAAAEGFPDWANFTQPQRLVIIVSVIAAWAIVTSADILGRSYATGHSNHDAPVLLTPIAANKIVDTPNGPDKKLAGSAVAVRPGAPVTFLWQPAGGEATAEWVDEKFIEFG